MGKAEINKKNREFRAEVAAAMARRGILTNRELIHHWGLPPATGYKRLSQPETITIQELRVLCAVLRMDDEAKARLCSTL